MLRRRIRCRHAADGGSLVIPPSLDLITDILVLRRRCTPAQP